jgi:hypothetical protein
MERIFNAIFFPGFRMLILYRVARYLYVRRMRSRG